MAENRIAIRITADGSLASAAIRDVNGTLNELNRTSGLAAASMSAFRGTMAALGSVGVTVGLGALAASFVAAAENAEKLDRAMTIVTGSSEAASKEMAFVAAVADKVGISATAAGNAYLSLAAAAKGTAVEGAITRDIFESISTAMGRLGKSSADTEGALLAIEQMISKGVVSAEELRGQLGERLPGAFNIAADAMGVTTARLDEMLKSGEVVAADLLPMMAQKLNELYGTEKPIEGLTAETNRLMNALTQFVVNANNATGATDILAKAMQGATWIANGLAQAMAAVASEASIAEQAAQKLQTLREKQARLQQEFAFQAGNLGTGKTGLWTGWLEGQLRDTATQLGAVTAEIAGMEKATNDAAAAQRKLANEQAAAVGNDAVQLWEAHKAKIEANNEAINKIVTSYDKGADKAAKMAKFETILKEAVTLGTKSKEEAAAMLEEYGKSLDGSEKKTTRAAKATGGLSKAKKEAATAAKELDKEQRKENQAMEEAIRTIEGLIRQYLPARAAAEEYAAAMAALDQASQAVGLSQEELGTITAGMARDQAQAAEDARRAADDFYRAWSDAVDSLDATFQSLWRGLLSGQDDVLSNLTDTVMEWIADLSYQLLLSPLVVPIQGALMGIMGGGMGLPGGAGGMVGGAANVASGIGGMSNMFSGLSSGFNLLTGMFSGSTYAGITSGFGMAMQNISTAGYFGAFGTNMSLVGSSAGSGAMGTAIGAALPYLVPAAIAIAGIGAIVSKWKKDQEPRYGTIAAQTGGRVVGLEDWENGPGNYSRGAFGLTFGITDKGSKNMKASELLKVYDALAEVTDTLAEFFGEDLTAFITEELKKLSTFGDGLLHLTENEGDLGAAMAMLVENIATAAGRSSEDIGIAFAGMVGDLSGSAEEVGEQIQAAMAAAVMAVELSGNYSERIGKMLALTGDIGADVSLLQGYIREFGTASETSAETLNRLVMQLGILDQAANNTATNLAGLSATDLIKLSDGLVDAFGGMDAASQAVAFFYQEFTTQTEKLVDAIEVAADRIDSKIPQLRDELMKLSEDVTTTITTVLEEIDTGLAEVATGAEVSVDIWVKLRDKMVDRFGEDLVNMMDAIHRESVDLAEDVGDEFGNQFVKIMRDLKTVTPAPSATKTVTTPGDPNAAILAQLLNDLPKTRQGFEDLIGAIDLTTEAGRKLYAGLLELAPQFDLLYDGVEAFTDWLLGVNDAERATRELTEIFNQWGMTLPANRDALIDLYLSGALTTEQMAILAAHLRELGIVFGDVSKTIPAPPGVDPSPVVDLEQNARNSYDVLAKSVDVERDAINTAHQARIDAINSERDSIDAAYQSRIDALNAERSAIAQAGEDRIAALAGEREAAQAALSAASAALSTIQSAISGLRGSIGIDEFSRARAQRQLQAWAASGTLPDAAALEKTVSAATTFDKQDFATANEYRAAQGSTLSSLTALEKLGLGQVDMAQKTLDSIEAQTEAIRDGTQAQLEAIDRQVDSANLWRDQQLDSLQAQLDAANAWRDSEMERLDQILEQAKQQLDIALGQEETILSLRDAIVAFNDALIALDPERQTIDVESLSVAMDASAVKMESAINQQSAQQLSIASAAQNELVALRTEIALLRADLAASQTAQVIPLKSIDDRLRKWDLDGLPGSGTTETALRAA